MCGGNGWMWNGGYSGGWGWAGWLVMTVVIVAFFALAITAIVAGVRYVSSGGHGPIRHARDTQTPEHLLAERYARGDIDDEEYRRRVTLLREHR